MDFQQSKHYLLRSIFQPIVRQGITRFKGPFNEGFPENHSNRAFKIILSDGKVYDAIVDDTEKNFAGGVVWVYRWNRYAKYWCDWDVVAWREV